MASNIDPTKPVAGNASTADERANWVAAKDEIEAMQIYNVANCRFTTDASGNPTLGTEKGVTSVTKITSAAEDYFEIKLDNTLVPTDTDVRATVTSTAFTPGDGFNTPFLPDIRIIDSTTIHIQIFNTNSTTFTGDFIVNLVVGTHG